MELSFLKKIGKGKVKVKKPPFFGNNPYRDWKILLLGFFSLVLLVALFAGYLFLGIKNGELFLVTSQSISESNAFDQKVFDELLGRFKTRAALLQNLDVIQIEADPSSRAGFRTSTSTPAL